MTAADLQRQVDQTMGVYQSRVARTTALQADVTALKAEVETLRLTEIALAQVLSSVSAESLALMEQTITYGLRTVFDDHPLAFKFVTSQARGGQAVTPVLLYKGVEAPILDAFGGGPASVVAFLLRLLVCHRLGLYPLILLDETFAMVSEEYIPNVATLLKELATKLGFTFLLVTHQPAFLDHADKGYRVVEVDGATTFRET